MKKIITILLLIINLGCSNLDDSGIKNKHSLYKEKIIQALEKEFPKDKFYFIYGLHPVGIGYTITNYKGGIYSETLKNLNYGDFLLFEDGDLMLQKEEIEILSKNYEFLLFTAAKNEELLKKSKSIFGNRVSISNGGGTNSISYKILKSNSIKGMPYNLKTSYSYMVLNIFVEDLKKIDKNIQKLKINKLLSYINENYNFGTNLEVVFRDDRFFNDYNLVKDSLFKLFKNKKKIKKILFKIQNRHPLKEKDRLNIIDNLRLGSLKMDTGHIKVFNAVIDKKRVLRKRVIYNGEFINGEYIED